jgi:hypothetical protein
MSLEGRLQREEAKRRAREDKRTCGSCSLCCKLLGITKLNKPVDTWCPHARPGHGGCSIYPDRPSACQTYICGWLSGLPEFGDEWFPARCKMIISIRDPQRGLREGGMRVTVDPAYPNAWRREPYYSQLRMWAQHIVIEIRVGRRFIRLSASGAEQTDEVPRALPLPEWRPPPH